MEVPEAKTLEAKDAASPGQIRVRNRALILAAAEDVFATQGYRGATTAAIAKKAGLPKANVHYYFGTKEALYAAVLRSEEHTSVQSLMRISYAVFCLKKKRQQQTNSTKHITITTHQHN